MEVKRIEMSALLCEGHSKFNIAKRLKNGEDLKTRPRSGRPQVVKHLAVRKAFGSALKHNDCAREEERLGPSVATVSNAVKEEGSKSLKCVERPLITREREILVLIFTSETNRIMSGHLKASTEPSVSTSTVGVGDTREGSFHSKLGSVRTVSVGDDGTSASVVRVGGPSKSLMQENYSSERRFSNRSSGDNDGSEDNLLAEEKMVERSGTSVVFVRVRRGGDDEGAIGNGGDDMLKPRLSQAKRQWSIQAVKGKVTTSCLWNACKALTIGTLLILIGAVMATIGYYAEEANLRRLQNLTKAASVTTESVETPTTTSSRSTTFWKPPQIVEQPKSSHIPKEKPKESFSSSFGLNKLSYVGPMVMGIGGFVIVAACVMTFEARDSAAKIVPARFRKPFPERAIKVEESGVRHCAAQTKWETLGVYEAELAKYHQEKELSRRALTSAFIRFSKTIQSSMDSITEYYEMKGQKSNLAKCPSAPSLIREFQQEEKRSIEAPRILRVSAFPQPPSHRRLSTNAYPPRQAISMDNPAVQEMYSPAYPAFIGQKGDEDMELGASATGVHRVDSEASLALDLHLPFYPVTLLVRDSSRSPSAQMDQEEGPPSTPLLDQVIIVPPDSVAGPSGVNPLHVIPIQPKVDKQTSTTDHNNLAMMGWSRDTLESRDNGHTSRSKSGGSFREAKLPKASRKVKRSETIDTASSAHKKTHKSHHSRSRAGSIISTHEGRRLGPTRSETSRKHQLLRQTKVEGSEINNDTTKGVIV